MTPVAAARNEPRRQPGRASPVIGNEREPQRQDELTSLLSKRADEPVNAVVSGSIAIAGNATQLRVRGILLSREAMNDALAQAAAAITPGHVSSAARRHGGSEVTVLLNSWALVSFCRTARQRLEATLLAGLERSSEVSKLFDRRLDRERGCVSGSSSRT